MKSKPLDPVVEGKIKAKLEKSIPDGKERRAAFELFAYAIESADAERSDAWYVAESSKGLKLFAGRLLVCRVTHGRISLSVVGPIKEDVLEALNVDPDKTDEFAKIPNALFITFHVEKAADAMEMLKDPIDRFVDEAVARVRTSVDRDKHVPEAVAYVASVVGRELPQPSEAPDDDEDDLGELGEEDDEESSREPKPRGRATIFEHSQRAIASLLDDVKQNVIALPNLQRPFVWEDKTIRDLLDSLFVGFPVGTLVLWHTSEAKNARVLGQAGETVKTASKLVIDGQQRLTSLYAVMTGYEVIDKDGSKRKISIAFRPRDGKFEVTDAAILNDPEYIPNVTELWTSSRTPIQIRKDLLKNLEAKGRVIDEAYQDAVEHNLAHAKQLSDYRFPIVDIRKTSAGAEASEEDVAEIFVRINNQGKRLGQADFVLTLLSVFHGGLRDRIEDRAIVMSKNAVMTIDTQQLLRAACAVGFGRARMSAIYRLLRGMDPTGDTTVAARDERLKLLDVAADECMHPTMWSDYMLRVVHAGLVTQSLIASNNGVVNAYALYVLGVRAKVPKPRLDELVSRWLFATQLTARYSGSSETRFEQDLSLIAEKAGDSDGFVRAIDAALAEVITGDFWTHTLAAGLQKQRGRSPVALAFRAAQVVLGARGLFSDQSMRNLLAPPTKGARSAAEVHHLFPKAWLASNGVKEKRRINQLANLADTGWWENAVIADRSPAKYVPVLRDKLKIGADQWGRACAEHGLPLGWELMDYETFLKERRQRMADIIRVAYRKLGGESEAVPLEPPWFLPGAELVWRQVAKTEQTLRALVRSEYVKKFGGDAAKQVEAAIPEAERPALARALRSRPPGADPLSVIDYLYLGQLLALVFAAEVWGDIRQRMKLGADSKQRLAEAVQEIAFVRNEIAHVREVSTTRLQKGSVACNDVMAMVGSQL